MGELRGTVKIFPTPERKKGLIFTVLSRWVFCRRKELGIGSLAVSCRFHGNPFSQVTQNGIKFETLN